MKKPKIENTARHSHSFYLHQNTHGKVRVVLVQLSGSTLRQRSVWMMRMERKKKRKVWR